VQNSNGLLGLSWNILFHSVQCDFITLGWTRGFWNRTPALAAPMSVHTDIKTSASDVLTPSAPQMRWQHLFPWHLLISVGKKMPHTINVTGRIIAYPEINCHGNQIRHSFQTLPKQICSCNPRSMQIIPWHSKEGEWKNSGGRYSRQKRPG